MISRVIKKTVDLNAAQKVDQLSGPLYQLENGGHKFEITILKDGASTNISGSVSARFVRADGETVFFSGTLTNNVATVTLPQNCYVVNGRFGLVVFVAGSGVTSAVYALAGTVYRSTTDAVVDPEGDFPSVEDVMGIIDDCETATAAATAASAFVPNTIAPAYSASETYEVGDYVTKDGYLYRSKTAISTAEAWTAAHWDQMTVGDMLSLIDNTAADNAAQDARLTGNVVQLYEKFAYDYFDALEIGSINSSGQETSGTSRVRTYEYISMEDFLSCDITGDTTYQMYVFLYDSAHTFLKRIPSSFTNMSVSREDILNENLSTAYLKFLFHLSTDSSMSSTDVDALKKVIMVKADMGDVADYKTVVQDVETLSDDLDAVETEQTAMGNTLVQLSEIIMSDNYANLEIGSIDSSGQDQSGTLRARTSGYISMDDFLSCDVTDTTYQLYAFLYDSGNTFIKRIPSSFSNIRISRSDIISEDPSTAKVRFLFKRSDGGTVTSSDIDALKKVIFVKGDPDDVENYKKVVSDIDTLTDEITMLSDEVSTVSGDIGTLSEIIISDTFADIEIGSIDSSGQETSGTSRIRTGDYINTDDFISCDLTGHTDYQMFVFLYNSSKVFLERIPSAWANTRISRTDILTENASAKYIKFLFRKASDVTLNTTDVIVLKQVIFVRADPDDIENYKKVVQQVGLANSAVLSTYYENIVQGSISSSGAESAGTTRGRTADYIRIDDFLSCDMSGLQSYFLFAFFYAQDKTLIQRIPSNWANMSFSKPEILDAYPTAKYVKVAFKRSDDATFGPDDISAIKKAIYVTPAFLQKNENARFRARFDSQFNYISYSKLTGGAPANSDMHFLDCAKADFTGLKGDVQPTSDSKLIMCHDAGYTFDANGKITTYNSSNSTAISTLTAAQCKVLTFADQFDGQDCHPIDFDDYVRICKKYGKIAFVTVRDTDIATVVAPEVMRVLKKYRMTERAIINSYTFSSLSAFRSLDSGIMLSLVLTHNAAPTTTNVDTVICLGNCLLNLFNAPVQSGTTLEDVLTAEDTVLQYAYDRNVIVYDAQTRNADTDTLMKHGIMGTHMYDKPDYLA